MEVEINNNHLFIKSAFKCSSLQRHNSSAETGLSNLVDSTQTAFICEKKINFLWNVWFNFMLSYSKKSSSQNREVGRKPAENSEHQPTHTPVKSVVSY